MRAQTNFMTNVAIAEALYRKAHGVYPDEDGYTKNEIINDLPCFAVSEEKLQRYKEDIEDEEEGNGWLRTAGAIILVGIVAYYGNLFLGLIIVLFLYFITRFKGYRVTEETIEGEKIILIG